MVIYVFNSFHRPIRPGLHSSYASSSIGMSSAFNIKFIKGVIPYNYRLIDVIPSVYEKQPIVNQKGLDIFGNDPQSLKKNVDCTCPNCGRTLGAQKFAPHLEKCMGMGRNSSRLANKK